MRRWMMVALIGAAGCQTATESETQQALTDPCYSKMPSAPVWDGSQPPVGTPTQIYIMSYPVNGYALTALVDYTTGKIPYARQVPNGKRSGFIAQVNCDHCRIVTGGNPPPPPDIIQPSLLGAFFVASAQRYAGVPTEAAQDVAACPLPIQKL